MTRFTYDWVYVWLGLRMTGFTYDSVYVWLGLRMAGFSGRQTTLLPPGLPPRRGLSTPHPVRAAAVGWSSRTGRAAWLSLCGSHAAYTTAAARHRLSCSTGTACLAAEQRQWTGAQSLAMYKHALLSLSLEQSLAMYKHALLSLSLKHHAVCVEKTGRDLIYSFCCLGYAGTLGALPTTTGCWWWRRIGKAWPSTSAS